MEIIDEVRSIIAEALDIDIDRLTPEARLDELGAESLDVIEIVFRLEEKFDISIALREKDGSPSRKTSTDLAQPDMPFSTVDDVANMVKHLIEAKKR